MGRYSCLFKENNNDFDFKAVEGFSDSLGKDKEIYDFFFNERLVIQKSLIDKFTEEDFEGARNSINQLMDYLAQDYLPKHFINAMMYTFLDMVFLSIHRFTEKNKRLSFEKVLPYDIVIKAIRFSSVDEVKLCISEIFENLMKIKKETVKDSRVAEIRKYIDDNIENPELSLNNIASNFGLHFSYISNAFKKEYECKIVDYIHIKRIERAKELLVKTKLSVSTISSKVGYCNYRTMITIFKRNEGITPNEYRNTMKKIISFGYK